MKHHPGADQARPVPSRNTSTRATTGTSCPTLCRNCTSDPRPGVFSASVCRDPVLRATHHKRIQHLAHAMSYNLCAREARDRLGGAIPQRNAAILIRQGNALRQTVQRRFQQLRAVHVARSFHPVHRRTGGQLDFACVCEADRGYADADSVL